MAVKQRPLSDAETAARKKLGGLTRREHRAKNSKFTRNNTVTGEFEVIALFAENTTPQTAAFPHHDAALSRFVKLVSNPSLVAMKLVQYTTAANGVRKTQPWYSFTRYGTQEFANSTVETLWSEPNGKSVFGKKAIMKSPVLYQKYVDSKLEPAKTVVTGGKAWWENRA